ncbi:MAG: molecular chaperone HtpG [Oscillospiraceae bacterium]|nr:molecular chaperone HtpG [Oscillospiraceae bacterium]
MLEKGGISVETRHIFPIIKRWLYSDKEIFLREIVSNSCDAVTKIKRLISLGEIQSEDIKNTEFKITVELNSEENTLKVTDNGIGMNAEEVKKYINQIALSGALDFIEKYESNDSQENSDKSGETDKNLKEDTAKNGIIGHFGLGFYSAFMVSDKVDIRTKSYAGSPGVFWTCTDDGNFELYEGDSPDASGIYAPEKTDMGTEVILHINDENKEFMSEYKIKDILDKYCAFMPVPIYFTDVNKKHEHDENDGHEHHDHEHSEEEDMIETTEVEKPINDISPLWTKNPSSCTKEEYSEFYRKVFKDFKEPLFYIHINADYPLNFKGILYFPKINTQFDSLEGQVKLYYNQVFVADNIKEVIPEYLLMLKGVIDCPELPLNVSRSYLQNSGYVSRISAHIVKKVGDKLTSLFNTERKEYEGFWQDIKTFILYGCLRDQKFYDRLKDIIIYKNTQGEYKTLDEYINAMSKDNAEIKDSKDKKEVSIYYTNNPSAQAVYVSMHQRAGREVLILENIIETQFISLVEMRGGGDKDKPKVKFVRVDSDLNETADKKDDKNNKDKKEESPENQGLIDLFKDAIGMTENPDKFKNLKMEVSKLSDDKIPALLTLSEQSRRIADMMKQYKAVDSNMAGMADMDYEETLIINSNNSLIQKLMNTKNKETARYIYMLSLISKRELTAEELEKFMEYSIDLCDKTNQ